MKKSSLDKIKIKLKNKENEAIVTLKDDGKKISKKTKQIFRGKAYTGETAGEGGIKYYIIKEIAEQNKTQISVGESEMGGAKFIIQLKKLKQTIEPI